MPPLPSHASPTALAWHFADWSTAIYVFLPAGAYAGNRFPSLPLPYSPRLPEDEVRGVATRPIITDIPRLADGPGPSSLQLKSGDLAFPAFGCFDPRSRRAWLVLADDPRAAADCLFEIEENADRSTATFRITSPAVPASGAPVLRLPAATYLGDHLADFVHGPASSFSTPQDVCWLPGPAFGAVWKTYFDAIATSTANSDALAQTLVTASPLRAGLAENAPANTIAFGLVRTGAATSSLTVNLSWSGTATAGADYATPPATVTFPAGTRSLRVALSPVADSLTESAETITLAPAPGTGYVVSDSPAATVTLGAAGTGTTSFTLTTNATNGTIARSPNQASYPAGTVVTLTATPASGYTFTGWSGDLTGTTNPASITLNANRSVTANFSIQTSTTVRVAEPFAYSAGVLEGQGLVSGNWTGAWTKVVGTASANVDPAGLTHPGLGATAGKITKTATGTGNAIGYRRNFSAGTLFNAGNSAWFSALVRPTTTTGGVHLLVNNGGGSSQGFGLTVNSGTLRARVGTVLSATTLPVSVNATTLVVGRIDTSASGNETVTVWTNPDLVSGPSGPGVSASANYDTVPTVVRVITNNANATWELDEIRVGPSFDSVTP